MGLEQHRLLLEHPSRGQVEAAGRRPELPGLVAPGAAGLVREIHQPRLLERLTLAVVEVGSVDWGPAI